ncbi:MAG: transcription-repair coupling factor [Bacteroidota bacterium]
MQVTDFIAHYKQHGWVKTLAHKLQASPYQVWHLKGLSGSLDAVLAAAVYDLSHTTQLYILHDKEEAAHFYNDLQSLLPHEQILHYPAVSQPTSTARSNGTDALMQAVVLHQLGRAIPSAIVTYPEALASRVIARDALVRRTFTVQVGEELITAAIADKLTEQGFEKVDFVYEPGCFAVRGGIVDIFSYAHPWPYRLELLGQTVESIRTFDPANQGSVASVQQAAIMPHIQVLSTTTAYQSFLDFLPEGSLVWVKDYAATLSIIEQTYQVAQSTPGAHLPTSALSCEMPASWEASLQRCTIVEFGHRFYRKPYEMSAYPAAPQPTFNEQFELLAEDLHQNQAKGLTNIITATSPSQLDRLADILAALDATVQFQALQLGLHQGFIDQQVGIACYTDHQLFGRYYRHKSPQQYTTSQAVALQELQTLQPGDYVVHIDYGIARFAGLTKVAAGGTEQETLRLIYKDNDVVYASVHALHKISKYTGKEGAVPTISKLGTSAWEQKKKKVKQKVQDIAQELIQLYSQRKHAPGFAFSKDSFLQTELESSFLYEDTPDQAAATADVKRDMEAPHPMDRLVCGDVGFGKTEVAIRAAFKAIHDGKQVAVLVPTTILALQHYESFKRRLVNFSVRVQYINRFKTGPEVKKILQATTQGQVDILIGTHQILRKAVKFKDLGLLIVDEEQKFGVKAKERLKELKLNVDVLTLTATPIPRTLHFSLMGARDLSIIMTPPPNRQPVATSIHTFDNTLIQEAIRYEVQRAGQVFFVHNRVANIQEVASMVHKLVPGYKLGVAHGQLPGNQLEQSILQFMAGEYDILVSTNIIESGLDIPNANTIIINDSHLFGLSDLHQMRGRVGRSNQKAFCYLIAPPTTSLSAEARKRLRALEEFSELGNGFQVAMRDLDIRGAGDLLGFEQSGFIADMGFETYCKILDEAVQELKLSKFKELFAEELAHKAQLPAVDCTLETDLALLVPNTYVSNDTERLRLYTKLDNIKSEAALASFQAALRDQFGPLPLPVQELIKAVELRWMAQQLSCQKIRLKEATMRCYFTPSPQHQQAADRLTYLLSYVQQHPQRCQLKETKNQLVLTIQSVANISEARAVLQQAMLSEAKYAAA